MQWSIEHPLSGPQALTTVLSADVFEGKNVTLYDLLKCSGRLCDGTSRLHSALRKTRRVGHSSDGRLS